MWFNGMYQESERMSEFACEWVSMYGLNAENGEMGWGSKLVALIMHTYTFDGAK